MALGSQDPDYSTADLNNDGIINILDIVQIVNIVLDERVSDAESAILKINQRDVQIVSDGMIAGIQMTLKHEEDFLFSLTENCITSGSRTSNGETVLIIVHPEDENIMSYSGEFEVLDVIIANSYGEINILQPSNIELGEAFPNPFNPSTTFNLYLPNNDYVSINVYDVKGRKVNEILNKYMGSGSHQIHWNASSLPSGIYFVKALSGVSIATQKVTLIK